MIFLDTGFIFAVFARDDANHQRVRAVMEEFRGRRLGEFVVTTNHVVAETITLLRSGVHRDARVAHEVAVRVGR